MKMSTVIEFTLLILLFCFIGINYQKGEKVLIEQETSRIVKATFSPSLEESGKTCFSLEGSKRSFSNFENKYNEKTVFTVVEALVNGKKCVRRVLADNKPLLEPSSSSISHCINYEIPDSYCRGGRRCVLVREHCY